MIFENIIRRFLFAKTTFSKSLNKPLPLRKRRLRAYSISSNPLLLIIISDMLRMLNINGIYYALHTLGMLHISLKQSLNARSVIQFLSHFLRLVVPVRATLSKRVNPSLVITVRSYSIIIVCAQPSFGNKSLHRPRLHHHLKQVSESLPAHSPRCGSQSQELRLRPSLPHHFVRLRQCMMSLIHDHQPRLPLHLLNIPRQPLNRMYRNMRSRALAAQTIATLLL